jgi:hypothetical protein
MKMKTLFQSEMSGTRRGRTIRFLILLSSCITGFLQAQAPPPERPQAPAQSVPRQLSTEELNGLLAPIALYPDALLALILPASTVSSDVVLAARYIASNGDPAQIANQPWDDSVKSLVRYPDVLKWMDQNLEWTTAVGEAFLDQPADVMNSIQGLRAEAIAAGNLTNSPQQQVVQEETVIRIVPAQPDVIYVPQYDPDVVYAQPYSQNVGPLLTFGAGFAVGSWLNYDCDWGRRSIYVGQWRPGWNHDRSWDRRDRGQNNNVVNVININSDTARQWQPSKNSQRQHAQQQRSNRANARNSQTSTGFPPSPNLAPNASGVTNATPGARGKNQRVPASTATADVPGEPGKQLQGSDQGSDPRKLNRHGQGNHQNVAPNASGVTNATPGARHKNREVSAPAATANVPGEQGKRLHSDGQGRARNLSKHPQSSHQSSGGANNQPTATPSNMQPGASAQKRQKQVDHSQSSAPQSKNSPQSSNEQKHQQKQAQQSAPSLAEQNKPSQPPPRAAHHEQNSRRSTPSAQQNNPSQPSNASDGKGKGGREKKSDKKEDKSDN